MFSNLKNMILSTILSKATYFPRFQRIATITTAYCQCAQSSTTPPAEELTLQNESLQKYLESLQQEYYDLRFSASRVVGAAFERMNQLNGIVRCWEQHRALQRNMVTGEDMENEKDDDMRNLIEEENKVYTNLLRVTEQKLIAQLLVISDGEVYPSLIFEINAGAGGQEAMLFARELFNMYRNFFEHNEWDYEVLAEESTDIGGLRHANITVNNSSAFGTLRYEAGVHRVQRVPSTEKSGRMHTSTASVAIIPRPAHVNVTINEKDLKIETKRASGAGGQHVNTTDSAVRVVHLPTGLAVESQSERSQLKNREIAINRLQAKLVHQQLISTEASKQATRKAQKGTLNRNEKIRTYNFVQDRITDHRLTDGTVHNLQVFLEGGEDLNRFIQRLVVENRKNKLKELIASWPVKESATTNSDSGAKKQKQKSAVKR